MIKEVNRACDMPPLEQKQRVLKWIQMKLRLHYPCQPVDPPPQTRISAGQVHWTAAFEIA